MEQETPIDIRKKITAELRKANNYTHIGRYIHLSLNDNHPLQDAIDYLKNSYIDNPKATERALGAGFEFLKEMKV